jgi:hypothetical protein
VDPAQLVAMSVEVLPLEVTQVDLLAEVPAEMLAFQALPVEMQVATQAHRDLVQLVSTAMQASMPAWPAA